ncbi:hypothetical protein LZ30DRAFT_472914 [Colletotrichum cereale]|nr:hypothetical protein LZ30DRAFT_472914 [Colletotrichum cereale]
MIAKIDVEIPTSQHDYGDALFQIPWPASRPLTLTRLPYRLPTVRACGGTPSPTKAACLPSCRRTHGTFNPQLGLASRPPEWDDSCVSTACLFPGLPQARAGRFMSHWSKQGTQSAPATSQRSIRRRRSVLPPAPVFPSLQPFSRGLCPIAHRSPHLFCCKARIHSSARG